MNNKQRIENLIRISKTLLVLFFLVSLSMIVFIVLWAYEEAERDTLQSQLSECEAQLPQEENYNLKMDCKNLKGLANIPDGVYVNSFTWDINYKDQELMEMTKEELIKKGCEVIENE